MNSMSAVGSSVTQQGRKRGSVAAALLLGVAMGVTAGCAQVSSDTAPKAASTSAPPGPTARTPDVIWVPSDVAVVMKMLEMAQVKPGDVVYDLGSGDGRIVILAAQKFGARGVGVDLNGELVRQSRENAVKAGVADRVTFLQQDLFVTDVSEATVVTLYLFPDVNLRLRPKLRGELRPGSRIVSHDYDLGDWPPEKTVEVSLPDRLHYVYLWRVGP
jgi:SAM-dependent methyltransferase